MNDLDDFFFMKTDMETLDFKKRDGEADEVDFI